MSLFSSHCSQSSNIKQWTKHGEEKIGARWWRLTAKLSFCNNNNNKSHAPSKHREKRHEDPFHFFFRSLVKHVKWNWKPTMCSTVSTVGMLKGRLLYVGIYAMCYTGFGFSLFMKQITSCYLLSIGFIVCSFLLHTIHFMRARIADFSQTMPCPWECGRSKKNDKDTKTSHSIGVNW